MRRDYSALPGKLTGTRAFENRLRACAPAQGHHLPGGVTNFRIRHVHGYHCGATIDVAFQAGYPAAGGLCNAKRLTHVADCRLEIPLIRNFVERAKRACGQAQAG